MRASALEPLDDTRRRGGHTALRTLALIVACALLVLPACCRIGRRWRVRHPRAMREAAVDEALKGTFPASDPPASRYVGIPRNRR